MPESGENPSGLAAASVAFGAISFPIGVVQNLFLVYGMELYLKVYRLEQWYFFAGHGIFLLWNALNDPVLAWWMDDKARGSDAAKRVRTHLTRISWVGPALAFSFLLFWYPVGFNVQPSSDIILGAPDDSGVVSAIESAVPVNMAPGGLEGDSGEEQLLSSGEAVEAVTVDQTPIFVHFVVSMCLYDGLFTYLVLTQLALMNDLTLDPVVRAAANRSAAFGSIASSLSVFASYLVWDSQNIAPFRVFVIAMVVLSMVSYIGAVAWIRSVLPASSDAYDEYDGGNRVKPLNGANGTSGSSDDQEGSGQDDADEEDEVEGDSELGSSSGRWLRLCSQLTSMRSFQIFVVMNLANVFMCHANNALFPAYLAVFFPYLPQWVCSLLIGTSFIAPHLNTIFWTPIVQREGAVRTLSRLFKYRWVTAVTAVVLIAPFALGSYSAGVLIAMWVFSNRMLTEGVCRLLNLPLGEIAEEHLMVYQRRTPATTFVYGLNALLTKPGQTLAPLFGWFVLESAGYKDLQPGQHDEDIALALWRVATWTPLVLVALQMIVWSKFPLVGARLSAAKAATASANRAQGRKRRV